MAPANPGAELEQGIGAAVEYWGRQNTRREAHTALIGITGAFTLARAKIASAPDPIPQAQTTLLLDKHPFENGEDWSGRFFAVPRSTVR
jgi:hypothetical protein